MKIWAVSLLTMELSPHSLTACLSFWYSEFNWKIRAKAQENPFSALPPEKFLTDASPKAISGRTSYYQARLAFHSLPQLIPEYCTAHGFGPPPAFQRGSPWPWQARLASGLLHLLNMRAFNTCFRFVFVPEGLKQRR